MWQRPISSISKVAACRRQLAHAMGLGQLTTRPTLVVQPRSLANHFPDAEPIEDVVEPEVTLPSPPPPHVINDPHALTSTDAGKKKRHWSGSNNDRPCVLMVFSHNDLRLHDQYALTFAHAKAKELGASLVCAYAFDVRLLSQTSLIGGFFRASPKRAAFLLDCVQDLQKRLRLHGSELIPLWREPEPGSVDLGATFNSTMDVISPPWLPEHSVPWLCQQLNVVEVFMTTQTAPHELYVQDAIRESLSSLSIERSSRTGKKSVETRHIPLHTVWSSTLIHPDDLSIPYAQMKESERRFYDEALLVQPRVTLPFNCADGRLRGAVNHGVRAWHSELASEVKDSSLLELTAEGYEFILPKEFHQQYVSEKRDDSNATESSTEEATERDEWNGTDFYGLPDAVVAGEFSVGTLPSLMQLGYSINRGVYQAELDTRHVGGETAALQTLDQYFGTPGSASNYITQYCHPTNRWSRVRHASERFPAKVSPWISTGCLSPRLYMEKLRALSFEHKETRMFVQGVLEAQRRLIIRDYYIGLSVKWGRTMYFPYGPHPEDTEDIPPFKRNVGIIRKWCAGLTGIPFVDAAMSELNETGWVADRARQAMVWLFTKGYGQDWRIAAEWLERTSLDYDPALCYGAIAYQSGLFKDRFGDPIFSANYHANQADASSIYVKKRLPQLSNVPDVYLHRLHVMTPFMMNMHGVQLGANYPFPMKLWDGAQRNPVLLSALPSYFAKGTAQDLFVPGWQEATKFADPTVHLSKTEAFPFVHVFPAVDASSSFRPPSVPQPASIVQADPQLEAGTLVGMLERGEL